MKNRYALLWGGLIFLLFPAKGWSQHQVILRGTILSADGSPLAAASVVLKKLQESITTVFCISTQQGSFTLNVDIEKPDMYLLQVTHIGYRAEVRKILLNTDSGIIDDFFFRLNPLHSGLKEVIVTTKLPSITVKQDTLEFNARAFMTPETIKLQDLLKNIRGFAVDGRGHITYDGKEVEKILLEGDDLAGKNYALVSKNLAASFVDKIQVLQNYNDNRLLKEVEKSGKVAINLSLGEKFKNKLSGTIAAGGSFEKRHQAEANLIFVSRKIKTLLFSNYNNTGDLPDADVQYYFHEAESTQPVALNDPNDRAIVKTGSVGIPAIDDKYSRNNNDLGNNLMLAWKMGSAIKMRALAGYTARALSNSGFGYQETTLPGVSKWITATTENKVARAKSVITQVSLDHDQQKSNAGSWSLSLLKRSNRDTYKNLTRIAITDTLSELLHSRLFDYRFSGTETFKLKKSMVLAAEAGFSRDHSVQDFNAATYRFLPYFLLDSLFSENDQHTSQLTNTAYLSVRLAGKKAGTRYNYGIRASWVAHSSSNTIVNRNRLYKDSIIEQPQSGTDFGESKYTVFGQLDRTVSVRGDVSAGMSLGYGAQKMDMPGHIQQHSSGLFKSFLVYRHRITEFRSATIRLETGNALPDDQLFYGYGFLSGNALIADGASVLRCIKKRELAVAYVSNNLFGNSHFFVNGSLLKTSGEYTAGYYLTPAFSKTAIGPGGNNYQAVLQVNAEKYYARLLSKIAVSVHAMQFKKDMAVNELPNRNVYTSIRTQVKYLTAFGLPVNVELSFTGMYLENAMQQGTGESDRHHLWQGEGYGKLKMKISKKIYTNLLYAVYLPGSKNRYSTLDAYFIYHADSKWTFSLTAHNILNTSLLTQKNIALNTVQESAFYLVKRYLLGKIAFGF